MPLPEKSTITLHTLSGDMPDYCGLPRQVISQRDDDAESLTKEWALSFAAHMRLPLNDCISFSWSFDGHRWDRTYKVMVLFTPLSDARRRELVQANFVRCNVCADDHDTTSEEDDDDIDINDFGSEDDEFDSQDELVDPFNCCVRCRSLDRCSRCKVMVGGPGPGRKVKCYWCLSDEELVQAKKDYGPTESFRMSLLVSAAPAQWQTRTWTWSWSWSSFEASAPTRGFFE